MSNSSGHGRDPAAVMPGFRAAGAGPAVRGARVRAQLYDLAVQGNVLPPRS
jgi:hypothetical protein